MAPSFIAMQYRMAAASFDAAKVSGRVTATEARVLKRQGGYVRTSSRRSIRHVKNRARVSKPGRPPRSHDPQRRYKLIKYAYDRRRHSAFVGHIKLGTAAGSRTLPEFFEGKGGYLRTRVDPPRRRKRLKSAAARAAFRRRFGRRRVNRGTRRGARFASVYVASRPATGPAFREAIPKLATFWRDQVRR